MFPTHAVTRRTSWKNMFELLQQNVPLVLMTAFLVAAVFLLFRLKKKWGSTRPVPKDTVLIYGVGRGLFAPSASPFPLKLETFCRLARIPYMVDHSGKMSSKGKTPWMEYNGRAVPDSQFCIDHLKAERGLDLDADLTAVQLAQARAFRELTEENLYWTMCHELFIRHPEQVGRALPYRGLKLWLVKIMLRRVVSQEMWGHGIGRHTDAQIWNIAARDLQALSDFLGQKKYFLGDEPHEVDCAVFGLLCQIIYHMAGTRHESHVREYLPNIIAFVERMKERFWPDWDERCKGHNYVEDEYKIYDPSQGNGYCP